MSREYGTDEVTAMFLEHMAMMAQYWDEETRAPTSHDKLTGLVHSICVMLSGGATGIPKFKVIPDPHPEDKQYHQEIGENWFPDHGDICFALNEIVGNFYNYKYMDRHGDGNPTPAVLLARKTYLAVFAPQFLQNNDPTVPLKQKLGSEFNNFIHTIITRNSMKMNLYTLATETMQPT